MMCDDPRLCAGTVLWQLFLEAGRQDVHTVEFLTQFAPDALAAEGTVTTRRGINIIVHTVRSDMCWDSWSWLQVIAKIVWYRRLVGNIFCRVISVSVGLWIYRRQMAIRIRINSLLMC